jgi:hypothetical protein
MAGPERGIAASSRLPDSKARKNASFGLLFALAAPACVLSDLPHCYAVDAIVNGICGIACVQRISRICEIIFSQMRGASILSA